jgi:hypothetical protein
VIGTIEFTSSGGTVQNVRWRHAKLFFVTCVCMREGPLNCLRFRSGRLTFARHFGFEFVLLLILCTASLFFFPVAHGSYSAIHGPVTALQSIKTKLQMWVTMAITACSPKVKHPFARNWRRRLQAYSAIESMFASPDQIFVLRC